MRLTLPSRWSIATSRAMIGGMRRSVCSFPIAALLWLTGCQIPEPVCPHAWQQQGSPSQPTANDGPVYDQRIQQSIERSLARLTAEEATATIRGLVEQLEEAERCKITTTAPGDKTLRAPQIHSRAEDAVVVVATRFLCGSCDDWHYGLGTGFLISADGAVATNRHVVEDHADTDGVIGVLTSDGVAHGVRKVSAASKDHDVVIIDIEGEGYSHLPLRPGLEVGEPVWVLGHPSGAFWYFTAGMLSRRFMEEIEPGYRVESLDITAAFGRGSSGSPVLDKTGAVVGIARSTHSVHANENPNLPRDLQLVYRHCVPVEALLELIEP